MAFLGLFIVLGVLEGVSRSLLSVELELASFWQVRVSFLFQSLNIAMSCLNLAIKLQHFRHTRNERRAVFNRTNPNFDSWLQMFSCVSLLSNISLDALIVPWMRKFTSHNLQKLFTAISTPVFISMVLFSPHTCVYSGSSRRLSRRIAHVITKRYVIGLRVHQWF